MKYIIKITLSISLLFSISKSYGQNVKSSFSFGGQVMASSNFKDIYVNMGGPNAFIAYKKASIGWFMFPSLRFNTEGKKPLITPILGTGPQITYGKFILGAPMYYMTSTNKWIVTVGIGIKLFKSPIVKKE